MVLETGRAAAVRLNVPKKLSSAEQEKAETSDLKN